MFKKILLCLIALKSFAVEPEPFALFTIPKSGSHLLIKTLYYITGYTPCWHTTPQIKEELCAAHKFPYTHCCLSSNLLAHYEQSTTKQILGVRDLRDVCVSIVYQIRKGTWPQFTGNSEKKKQFQKLSFDEQLLFVIQQEYEVAPPKVKLQLGIRKVAEQVMELIKNPNILVCRYEDLVGPDGGGCADAQMELLTQISRHIGCNLSPVQIQELSMSLYGNGNNPFGQGEFSNYQSTYRQGKIGGWKDSFKEIHKIAFKKRLGEALIALGYEKDDNW